MLNCKNSTIAIIDSGIGGVSVLKQLIEKFKAGNYIYFADNQFMPYGNKKKPWLKARMTSIIEWLQTKYEVSHIILACNTASSVIDEHQFKNLTVMQFNPDYTYFATNLTKQNKPQLNVIADKTLAKQIENHIFNEKKLNGIIKRHIKIHKLDKLNKFVLGCTHYELVQDIFKRHCKGCEVINNSSFVVDSVNFTFPINELNVVVLLSKNDFSLDLKINNLLRR